MPKNSLAAFAISLVIPGSGQIWNRETEKGLIIFGCCAGLAALVYWVSGLNKISMVLALILLWSSAAVDAYKTAADSRRPAEFYYRRRYVIVMLLLVGPLALPLLWQSPYFSRSARWIWTIIVIAVVGMFVATPYLLNGILHQAAGISGG